MLQRYEKSRSFPNKKTTIFFDSQVNIKSGTFFVIYSGLGQKTLSEHKVILQE